MVTERPVPEHSFVPHFHEKTSVHIVRFAVNGKMFKSEMPLSKNRLFSNYTHYERKSYSKKVHFFRKKNYEIYLTFKCLVFHAWMKKVLMMRIFKMVEIKNKSTTFGKNVENIRFCIIAKNVGNPKNFE